MTKDGRRGAEPASPTNWHALLERMELGVAEINQNAELVRRALGGKGLSFRNGGDSLEVTRAALPVIRLCVTNHGPSVSAEWETTAERGKKRVPLIFDTGPDGGALLRKESGARMLLDEAVRYLLTPLLWPQP